jgi:hypothetical protein
MLTFKTPADLAKLSRDDPAHDVIRDTPSDICYQIMTALTASACYPHLMNKAHHRTLVAIFSQPAPEPF